MQDVLRRHRVVVQVEGRDEHLAGDDVLEQLVALVTGIDQEEHVLAGMVGVVVGELCRTR